MNRTPKYHLSYTFFGEQMNFGEFEDLENPDFPAENVAAKLATNPKALMKFFCSFAKPIVIELKENEQTLAKARVDFSKIVFINPETIVNDQCVYQGYVYFQKSSSELPSDVSRLGLTVSVECSGSLNLRNKRLSEEIIDITQENEMKNFNLAAQNAVLELEDWKGVQKKKFKEEVISI